MHALISLQLASEFGPVEALESLGWMLLSIVKFVVTPSLALASGVPPLRVFVICSAGAVVGIFLLYPISRRLFEWQAARRMRRGRPVFTPGRRRVVRIKERWGLWGVLAFSGVISVPIAVLLGSKYFSRSRWIIPVLILSFILWSALLTGISWAVLPTE